MKTLYEILEVSETASKEVIEKAYKVLAKKHHPDLQTPENKAIAEKKMKEINEAYAVLGDEEKRKAYDAELSRQREIQKQQEIMQEMPANTTPMYQQTEKTQPKQRVDDMQRRRYEAELLKQQTKMQKQMEKQMQEQYQNAYYNYLRSLGYSIKEKWTWKKTITLIIIIVVLCIIGAILWYIPATHQMMLDFYNSNIIIKTLIDIIITIITALFKTIASIFQ